MKTICIKLLLVFCVVGLISTTSCNSKKPKRKYRTISKNHQFKGIKNNNIVASSKSNDELHVYLADNYNSTSKDSCDPCAEEKPCDKKPACDEPPCQYGHIIEQKCKDLPIGYNEDARIDLCKCSCWQFYPTASFIYWQAKEDGLSLAEDSITENFINNRETVRMNFDYAPGFKVGLGTYFQHDNWSLYLDYTRLHDSTSKSHNLAANHTFILHWLVLNPVDSTINQTASTWKYEYDMFNLTLQKPYYVSKNIDISLGYGLKWGWLDQKYNISYTSPNHLRTVNVKSDSWIIGPKGEIKTSWLLGYNFKILANGAFSMFYQKFTKVLANISDPSSATAPNREFKDNDVSFIRPNAELFLGLNYGDYISAKRYHFDISAGYELHYYWNQNMMDNIISRNINPNSFMTGMETIGDFMLHGLTINVRFDF